MGVLKTKQMNSRIRILDFETDKELDVLITSEEATETIVLNDLDVDFIEQDYNESGAINGNLDVFIGKELVNIDWQII